MTIGEWRQSLWPADTQNKSHNDEDDDVLKRVAKFSRWQRVAEFSLQRTFSTVNYALFKTLMISSFEFSHFTCTEQARTFAIGSLNLHFTNTTTAQSNCIGIQKRSRAYLCWKFLVLSNLVLEVFSASNSS